MTFVDGFVAAVPSANKQAYLEMAQLMAEMCAEQGALKTMENWGVDVPEGEVTSFPMAVKREDGEVVVFSWILWPSKEARDKAWEKMREDERMAQISMPFDGKRLIFGGFETILDV